MIGNPPYGVSFTAQEKEFFRENYESARTVRDMQKGSTDSFSLFMDKGLQLCSTNAILSYIVPLSFVSGESMSALHNMMFRTCETIRVSTYSNRPQKIFENADQRTAIVICHKNGRPTRNLYTTKVNKRYRDTPAADVIKNLQYVDSYPYVKYGRIPKVGSEMELGILQKLFAIKTGLSDLFDEKGLPVYYRSSGGRYYNIITNFKTGSTKEKSILVKPEYRDIIGAILSTNLYYWFYHIYSNNLDLKLYELEIFPVPAEKFTAKQIKTIDRLYKDYLADLHKNSKVKKADYATTDSYREYYARHSKQLIDKIDLAVQKAYGLTDAEIRFIINYDLEFRTDNEE
ncbi:MAG: Eco57I restriction-modification methylase domain-containing protein [Desulfobacterales bacterium]